MEEHLWALDIASNYHPRDIKAAKDAALEIISWAYLNSERCPEDVLCNVAQKALVPRK